jgi:hypothetical protein
MYERYSLWDPAFYYSTLSCLLPASTGARVYDRHTSWNPFRSDLPMKKIIALLFLTTLGWGAQGDSSLTVSSGTFLAIDGQTIANSNFRQTVVIGDTYSVAGVAQVDPVTGLTVHIASSSLTNGGVPVTVIGPGIQLASSTLNVNVPTAIQLASNTINVNVPLSIQLSSGTAANPFNVVIPLSLQLSSGTSTNPFYVQLSSWNTNGSTVAASQQGNWFVTVNPGIQLASSTLNVAGVGSFTIAQGTSTILVISTAAAIAIQNTAGVITDVGYQNGGSSVPVSVVGGTITVVPIQGTNLAVHDSLAVQLASGTPANPFFVQVPLSLQLSSGTPANPFNVTIPLSLQLSSGTPANPFNVVFPLSLQLSSGTPTNPFYVIVTASATVTGAKADNGVAAGTDRLPTLPSIIQNTYENGTAATQGRNAALNSGTDGLLWTANLPSLRPADFHASSATQVVASATDIAQICGQATTATLLTSIRVSCTQTTAGIVHLSILKRSNADQPGAAAGNIVSTMTVVASNSNFSANSTTATYVYTGNPTRGGLVGQLDSYNIGCMAPATTVPNDIYLSPAWWRTKPIVLNGIKECVDVSLANGVDGNGTTVTGGVFNINFDWAEVTAITP